MDYVGTWYQNNFPELIITILGWIATYFFLIRAQDKQLRNQIHHEIYKELIKELDSYNDCLSDFSSKIQSFGYSQIYQDKTQRETAFKKWMDEVIQAGLSLKFYKFLQRWESYEIFVQELNNPKQVILKENEKINTLFQEIFLMNDPEKALLEDKKVFEKKLDNSHEQILILICYVLDFKKILQTYFYKKFGLKALALRIPENSKYLTLTQNGLKKLRN